MSPAAVLDRLGKRMRILFPFMENFLSTLPYVLQRNWTKRFAVVHGKKITKKACVEATVPKQPRPDADICKILPDVSPRPSKPSLGVMVKNRLGKAYRCRTDVCGY